MKKSILTVFITLLSISLYAQDWRELTYKDEGGYHYDVIDDIDRYIELYQPSLIILNSMEFVISCEDWIKIEINHTEYNTALTVKTPNFYNKFSWKNASVKIYEKFNSDIIYTIYSDRGEIKAIVANKHHDSILEFF